MSVKISSKRLRAAAAIVESRMLAELDSVDVSPYEFSEGFEQKMRPLLKTARRRERAQQTMRTIAASLALVLLCGAIWVATHAEAREAVQRWFTSTWNNIITYRFTGERSGEFPTFRPTWLPEGYEEKKVFETDDYCKVTYEDNSGNLLFFFYQAMNEDSDIGFMILPDDEVRIESVEIRGLPGDFYIDTSGKKPSSLIWMDEQSGLAFGIDSKRAPDVILRIAESISEIKPTK